MKDLTTQKPTLLDFVKSSLEDEGEAKDKYEVMMELTKSDQELTESEKSLILGILFKIQTDEKTHDLLLEIIRGVLEGD